MASWSRRYPGGPVQVFKKKKKGEIPKRVPRHLYLHLDAMPDDAVDAWVRDYEIRFEDRKVTPDHLVIGELRELVERYLKYLQNERKLAKATLNYHRLSLCSYALPFFLDRETPLRDPAAWPGVSVHLLPHLQGKNLDRNLITKVNCHLQAFWGWLRDEGLVHTDLRLRRPLRESKGTPLPQTLDPDTCLQFAEGLPPDLRLLCLFGYFFSLRPNESFALDRSRFKVGTEATFLDCGKAMARAGLFNRLAVHVECQRRVSGEIVDVKTKASKGYVSCFDERAAKLLVKTVKDFSNRPWFPFGHTYYATRWEPNHPYTLKDLRRASLYWLGHFSKLTPVELQKHARHAKFETTVLYLRRPEEAHVPDIDWDLAK